MTYLSFIFCVISMFFILMEFFKKSFKQEHLFVLSDVFMSILLSLTCIFSVIKGTSFYLDWVMVMVVIGWVSILSYIIYLSRKKS